MENTVINNRSYTYYVKPSEHGVHNGKNFTGCVVCVCTRNAIVEVNEIISTIEDSKLGSYNAGSCITYTPTCSVYDYPLKAVSYCYEGDEFDVDAGMRIAREKVRKKFIKRKNRCMDEIRDYFKTMAAAMNHE